MRRPITSVLILLVAGLALATLAYVPTPNRTIASFSSTTVWSATHTDSRVLQYTYSNVTCASNSCFVVISAYTDTLTWTAEITAPILLYSTATSYVPYAFSGTPGLIAVALVLVVSLGGLWVLNKDRDKRI